MICGHIYSTTVGHMTAFVIPSHTLCFGPSCHMGNDKY